MQAPLFVEGWDKALHEIGRLSFATVLSPQNAAALLKSVEDFPILVVAGAEDALVPLKSSQAMASKLVNSVGGLGYPYFSSTFRLSLQSVSLEIPISSETKDPAFSFPNLVSAPWSATTIRPTTMNGDSGLHLVVVPLMAHGHLIPAIDMARLFAERGILVSVVTTPVNATRIRAVIRGIDESGLPIRFVELPFPCAQAGLPEGCEHVDVVPPHLFANFFRATALLRLPLESYLRDHHPRPSCIIADVWLPWTMEVARALRVPRLVCHWISCFAVLCYHNIRWQRIRESISDDSEPFVVPGLPDRIVTTRAQAPGFFDAFGWDAVYAQSVEAEETADGLVLNSFDDLEPSYIDKYREATGKKVWAIGPFCLGNRDRASKAVRGSQASVDGDRCMVWLDSMQPRSVLYVSFGSLTQTQPSQLVEIGEGLEESGSPFIWVIKDSERTPATETWLSGLEGRTKGRALVITGWAPQALILSHPAIGGFVTHCGWNSAVEGVSAGVPMITWPHFADQFLNEKLLVQVLKTAVPIGVEAPITYVFDKAVALVKREDVSKAVRSVMDGGEEGEGRRQRAQELGKKARKAVDEEGGSSQENLTLLLDCVSKLCLAKQ
ncbi:hypothetical protein BHM03_00004906 [Ensete ventricosum]|uniref:Glycosyltransferase N-terminal domain-containing protein n=1 Tax=Ensete ventricosum TaxID=4639 RepID=A0A445MAV5_ENSVE|nr:hypothetical protein BHM03_00004906 [Ensete ventricosum]